MLEIPEPEEQRSRGVEPWPWIVAGFLVATISVSLLFAHTAISNPDALVVDDAYAAGLAYNDAQRAREAADAKGWRFAFETQPTPEGVRVLVTARDASGAPLAGERLVVRRERPSEGGYDADFAVGSDGGVEIPLPRPGRWHLVATAERDGMVLERVYRVEAEPR